MPVISRSERARKRLEVTAYHEAGHAVAAFHLDRPFHHVTIEPKDDGLGHVLFTRFYRSFNPSLRLTRRAEATIENQVLIGMSGMAAERKFGGRSRRNWRSGSHDMKNALNLASYVYEGE